MLQHQAGYCDRCGCVVVDPQVDLYGADVCQECVDDAKRNGRVIVDEPREYDRGR